MLFLSKIGPDFMFCNIYILQYLFDEKVRQRLKMVCVYAILCNRSIDKSFTEQEVVYVVFADLESGKLSFIFFKVVAPSDSQDAPGLKKAITDSFTRNLLETIIGKLDFLSSSSTSANLGKNLGLIKLFLRDYP